MMTCNHLDTECSCRGTGCNNQHAGCDCAEDTILQDGVKCPKVSPWPESASKITGIPMVFVGGLGLYILVKTSIPVLLFWLFLLLILAYPLRYLVCARCPYYGQHCSTSMGKNIHKLFKKQEGKSMKLGLWLDVVIGTPVFLIPLPYAFFLGGWKMGMLWIIVTFTAFAVITKFGCSRCPFTFCPIGRAGRKFWGVPSDMD